MDPLQPGDPCEVGPYRLVGRLGAGGMGRVFLGRSPGGRPVAVKLIRSEYVAGDQFRDRFAREVQAARRVGGFHTAQVVDADSEADPPWMVTAYIPGPSLRDAVTEHGALALGALRVLGAGLAEGLAAIHGCGLVHRDLKPANVILAADGPRVIDFGIARVLDGGAMTASGVVLGTFAYMSPEQVRGLPAGAASDVFSFGAVLTFAATGRSPFDAASIAAIAHRISSEPPDLDAVPDEQGLRRLIAACLAKDPADRPTVPDILAQLTGPATSGDRLPPAITGMIDSGVAESHDALGTTVGDTGQRPYRQAVVAAGRDSAVVPDAAATRTLPVDVASFTGRRAQLEEIVGVLSDRAGGGGVVEVSAIDGMAGVGKTAFAVHAAHRLASRFPDGQIFLRLHGHTPGQRPIESADALAELLLTIGIAPQQIPAGLQAREGLWRDRIAGKKMLLLLDDATGSDQVRPLLPGAGGSLVLVTSRRRLTALQDAVPVTLDILEPGEAAQLFTRLAGRLGLRPADSGVVEVVALCGYLPLAIAMMAGQLKHHPAWTAADLAAELTSAKDRIAEMRAESDSVTAAFELSYRDLTAGQQRFFRRLGLQPGSDIDAYAAAALGGVDLVTARSLLEGLYSWHLIDEPARGRYRFHDLIRQHARTLTSAEPAGHDDAAMNRLLDYYLHAAQAADHHLAARPHTLVPAVTGPPSRDVPPLPTRRAAAGWMDTERLNLHAAVDYAACHDRPGHAIAIPIAMHGFLRTQGHWGQALALHHTALNTAQHTGDQLMEASTLGYYTGPLQRLTGDYPAATTNLTRALQLFRDLGDPYGESRTLNELGLVQQTTGDYPAATTNLTRALQLSRDLGDRTGEGSALNDLGIVQRLTGDYRAATTSQEQALQLAREIGSHYGEANILNELGRVQYLTGDHQAAAISLTRALHLFRDFGNRYGEAYVLTYLGRVLQTTGDHPAAATSLTRALQLSRDLGDRYGEAESLNGMGELSSACSRPAEACASHQQALAIARDIGSPAEQARALEGIGRSHLDEGRPGEGAARLRQARAIYQRLGAPDAQRVETTLRDHGL